MEWFGFTFHRVERIRITDMVTLKLIGKHGVVVMELTSAMFSKCSVAKCSLTQSGLPDYVVSRDLLYDY